MNIPVSWAREVTLVAVVRDLVAHDGVLKTQSSLLEAIDQLDSAVSTGGELVAALQQCGLRADLYGSLVDSIEQSGIEASKPVIRSGRCP